MREAPDGYEHTEQKLEEVFADEGISGTGTKKRSGFRRMIRYCNEGKVDLVIKKTYTRDYLTRMKVINNGELDMYYVRDDHEAIIAREIWDAIQLELKRRYDFNKLHHVQNRAYDNQSQFFGRVFCDACKGTFYRRFVKEKNGYYWKCKRVGCNAPCETDMIAEEMVTAAMVAAWNNIVNNRQMYLSYWQREDKNPLEALRAKQMINLTSRGEIEAEIPELTRMVLREITVEDGRVVRVCFLDGTIVLSSS